ncbi:MAG: hypothetical protein ACI9YL_001944 [Luteibaculaceae bacterium]|jgi:hypothetical protein
MGKPLNSAGNYSKALLDVGIATWDEFLDWIWNLPYGRHANRGQFMEVITEGKGTCSSKHALALLVASENNIPGVQLILGMVKMNEKTIPGIGNGIAELGLEYIPEAHCYLKLHGQRVDLTFPNQVFRFAEQDVVLEQEIQAIDAVENKNKIHHQFLHRWISQNGVQFSLDHIWRVREECIAKLSQQY